MVGRSVTLLPVLSSSLLIHYLTVYTGNQVLTMLGSALDTEGMELRYRLFPRSPRHTLTERPQSGRPSDGATTWLGTEHERCPKGWMD